MAKHETSAVVTSDSWDGLHFTCTADQAMWLFLALKDARDAVAKRTHPGTGTVTAYDQMLESADQWDFYNQLAGRAAGYATEKRASMVGLRFPDGRPYRAG
jgi:hypothetical protein